VKTTAMKAYLVSPSNALLEPGEHADVQILVTPSKQASDADRFLILATKTQSRERLTKEQWLAVPKIDQESTRMSVVLRADDAGGLQEKFDNLHMHALTMEAEKKKVDAEVNSLLKSGVVTKPRGFHFCFILLFMVIGGVAGQYIP
jgi:hypothetical protein